MDLAEVPSTTGIKARTCGVEIAGRDSSVGKIRVNRFRFILVIAKDLESIHSTDSTVRMSHQTVFPDWLG